MHFDQPDARRSANSMPAVTTIVFLSAPTSLPRVVPSPILDTDFDITVSAGWVFLRFLYRGAFDPQTFFYFPQGSLFYT
ncbi:hypothetical protein B0H19DRAFT_1183216 [Mycena capillaripes]|nr:hypothetical protein B0H19DRAFT_1183216 [Mycena capillaripes]